MDGTAVDFAQLATDVAPWTLAAVYAAVIFAGLVHGTLGLGFPLVSTPLIALVLDVRAAILLTLLPTAAVNLATIVHVGQWRATVVRFWPLVAAGAPFEVTWTDGTLKGRIDVVQEDGEQRAAKAALTIADTAAQEAILVPLFENFPDVTAGMHSSGFRGLHLNPKQEAGVFNHHRVADRLLFGVPLDDQAGGGER